MTTHVDGYCSVFDYDFSSIVYDEGVEPSGGGEAVEEITIAGRKYGDIRNKGRQPKKYVVRARSTDREEIETFLRTCNTLQADAEFYPFDAERMGYIASAFASLQAPKKWGLGQIFYEANAEILCREAWLYGPDQGIDFVWWEPLPSVSALLTNEGHERSPISYMQCSGDYAGGYVEDLSVRITPASTTGQKDRELELCEKMLRADLFELGWRGEVRHSYSYECDKSISALSIDLHGLVSGGVWSTDTVLLDNGSYIMIPFYGPLPVSGNPGSATIELDIEAIGGDGGAIQVAEEIDLSDIEEVSHDALVVGSQTVNVPDLEGKGLVVMGIKADVDPFEPFAGPTLGNCLDIAVAADGSIYVVSDLYHLWKWDATSGWVKQGTTEIQKVAVGQDGSVFALEKTSGDVLLWAGGDSWTHFGGSGEEIAVRTATELYVITVGHIFIGDGVTWVLGDAAKNISVDHDGILYRIGSDDIPYYQSGASWVFMGGVGAEIVATNSQNVYLRTAGGTIYKFVSGSWSLIAEVSGIAAIDISADGILAGVTTDAKVWQRPYILLSGMKGVVNRYIAPSKIPWSDPDETFKIRVESSNDSRLRLLQACWNNRYWY
jgi:hypothetical protein